MHTLDDLHERRKAREGERRERAIRIRMAQEILTLRQQVSDLTEQVQNLEAQLG